MDRNNPGEKPRRLSSLNTDTRQFLIASYAYDAPSGRVPLIYQILYTPRVTYSYLQIRRCAVTGLVLCAVPE